MYADERIGELLSELPKDTSFHGNQHHEVTLPTGKKTKTEALHDAGLTPKTASQLEQLAAHPEVVEETMQLQAKVSVYADQRIGEILRELPTKQGARNDITSVGTPTKAQAIKDARIDHHTAVDLQTLAANPEVVEAVIAKAEEEGKVFWGKRFRSKPHIHIWPCGCVAIDCGT